MLQNIYDFFFSFFASFDLKYKLITLIILYLVGKYYYKKYNIDFKANKTVYDIDPAEVPNGIDFQATTLFPKNKMHYVFWTGGFTSTYRICELLLLNDLPVQPIYLMCKSDSSSSNILFNGNESRNLEIIKMKEIRDMILKHNPHLANKFYPTYYVTNIQKNPGVKKKFKRIHNKLGYYSKDIEDYEKMALFSLEFNKPIEVGIDNCGTGFDEATKKLRTNENGECMIKKELALKDRDMEIFRQLRFPNIHLTKDEMKEISIKNNFYHIIKNSWTCWFPKNGFPCGKCKMCKDRII